SLAADGVIGTPAIGAGDAGNARIYLASMNGDLYAIEANGDADAGWNKLLTTVNLFAVGPAIAQAVTGGGTVDEVIVPAADGGILVGVDSSLNLLPSWDGGVLTDGLAGEPTFGIDGKLYGANLANQVFAFDAGTGAATPFVTLAGVGMTPLQGSDGHVYLPRRPSSVDAYDGNLLSWTFRSPGQILRYGTMDCAGRLFVASGATV